MSELKPSPMEAYRAAEKLQESYDYMTHFMPEGKRSQSTIDLLAAMSCAIFICRAQPVNEPLTLDELREMDGKPVWVTYSDGSGGHYAVLRRGFLGLHADDGDTSCWFEFPQSCIAYRCKPEGSEKNAKV